MYYKYPEKVFANHWNLLKFRVVPVSAKDKMMSEGLHFAPLGVICGDKNINK